MGADKLKLIENTHFAMNSPYLIVCYSYSHTVILDNFILKWQEERGGRCFVYPVFLVASDSLKLHRGQVERKANPTPAFQPYPSPPLSSNLLFKKKICVRMFL